MHFHSNKQDTLKKNLLELRGEVSRTRHAISTLKTLHASSGQQTTFKVFITRCVGYGFVGFALGLLLNSLLAPPLSALLFGAIPIWQLKLYNIRYNKYIAVQLESTLSLISASYIRSNNIELSVTENLPYIDPIIKSVFNSFITEYKISPNVINCIENMSLKIQNPIFLEWCTGLKKAYTNTALKNELSAIANKLSTVRIIQDNLDTEMRQILSQCIIMLVMLVLSVPLIYLINYEWFLYFFTHPLGRGAIAFAILALIVGIHNIIKFTQPVTYGR